MSASTSVFAMNSIIHARLAEQARNPPHLQHMRANAPCISNNLSIGTSMAPPPQATNDNSRKASAASDLTQATDVPPPLAPSVEEAYRRKCIQLKQRLNEIEADNEATRVRVQRIERSIQKQRIERAFLLEQLAKRTSTNVEDSEGSPSPPPTPKEKPLRTKRGHRKPSFLANLGEASAGSAFIQQGPNTLSPSSDAFSHTHPDPVRNSTPNSQIPKRLLPTVSNVNGTPTPAGSSHQKRPKTAWDLFCSEMRPIVHKNNQQAIVDGAFDVEGALARAWRELPEPEKQEYQIRIEAAKKQNAEATPIAPRQAIFDAESRAGSTVATADDEDVEMGDEIAVESGFTPVNRE
ncbi:hypothetical protein LAWI1_G003062 [Lachnellula willkommii]|uniref:HMG box domain-containing protein n=1 Tax=Lachnellula willkommii TaxID=215461 RepID=A0A559MGI5_9HELO|nr:hypothetical protein LAWI1_G003062 [Lachnellula willkommii]